MARESAVLLRRGTALPLEKGRRLAVIGEFAQRPRYQGAGSSKINPTRLVSLCDALDERGVPYVYTRGFAAEGAADPALEEEALEKTVGLIEELKEGDPEAFEQLMYALLLSGIAMQMVGNSRPASSAEHHVSHLWEMEVINDKVDALHGEKVSVGLVMVRKRYEEIAQAIEKGECRLKPYHGLETDLLRDTFGKKGLMESAVQENTPDPLDLVEPEKLMELLPEIAKILDTVPSSEELVKILQKAGCCYEPEQVGISRELVPMTLQLCPYVRNRLSFLRISKMLQWTTK